MKNKQSFLFLFMINLNSLIRLSMSDESNDYIILKLMNASCYKKIFKKFLEIWWWLHPYLQEI